MDISKILVKDKKIIKEDELALIKDIEEREEKSFLEATLKIVPEEEILRRYAKAINVEYIDLMEYDVDLEASRKLSSKFAKKKKVLPIGFRGKSILVVMQDPLDIITISEIKNLTHMSVIVCIGIKAAFEKISNEAYTSAEETTKAVSEFQKEELEGKTERNTEQIQILNQVEIGNSPIVKIVTTILTDAVKRGASDIHIEPFEDRVRVRFRIDGELRQVLTLPASIHAGLTTRIKITCGLDIAERKKPQDGRVSLKVEEFEIDTRVSVLPSIYGEKIVIRILDQSGIEVTKEQLGFTKRNLEKLEELIKITEGMILLTGPTGSGKTTTLYTILKELNKMETNIVTLEDPVEYKLDGINQVHINNKVGLTFSSGLRSILRQDPDIILLGEIRDEETAEIAIKAAITGHVVLSTLHTNDTASTLTRLVDMGIESFLVANAVKGVIAQRLARRICTNCKVAYKPDDRELEIMGRKVETLYRGKGCRYCDNTGYRGRVAVHEVMILDKDIRDMINSGGTIDQIKKRALDKGMYSLAEEARGLAIRGITTVEQMVKIAFAID